VDWEYEEHKVRLKTLAVSHEAEMVRLDKLKLERQFLIEKHAAEMELLKQRSEGVDFTLC